MRERRFAGSRQPALRLDGHSEGVPAGPAMSRTRARAEESLRRGRCIADPAESVPCSPRRRLCALPAAIHSLRWRRYRTPVPSRGTPPATDSPRRRLSWWSVPRIHSPVPVTIRGSGATPEPDAQRECRTDPSSTRTHPHQHDRPAFRTHRGRPGRHHQAGRGRHRERGQHVAAGRRRGGRGHPPRRRPGAGAGVPACCTDARRDRPRSPAATASPRGG